MGRVSKPLVPVGPVREFYDRLHHLHGAAGRPKPRHHPRRAGLAPAGELDTVRALVEALGGAPAEFAVLWRLARADVVLDGAPAGGAPPVVVPQVVTPRAL